MLGAAEDAAARRAGRAAAGSAWLRARRRRWSPSLLTAAYATRLWLLTFFGAAPRRRRAPRTSRRAAMRWPAGRARRARRVLGLLGLRRGCRRSAPRDRRQVGAARSALVDRGRCSCRWCRVGWRRRLRRVAARRRRDPARGLRPAAPGARAARSTSTRSTTALVVRPVRRCAPARCADRRRDVVDGATSTGAGRGARAALGGLLRRRTRPAAVQALPHGGARRRGRCSSSAGRRWRWHDARLLLDGCWSPLPLPALAVAARLLPAGAAAGSPSAVAVAGGVVTLALVASAAASADRRPRPWQPRSTCPGSPALGLRFHLGRRRDLATRWSC